MYCVPDSIALAIKQDKALVRAKLGSLIGHDPAICYGDEHVRAMPHITGRASKDYELFPKTGRPVRLKDIIVREFKRGPFLLSFYTSPNWCHFVYVDGGIIHCNEDGSVWYGDYKWALERARVRQVIRP